MQLPGSIIDTNLKINSGRCFIYQMRCNIYKYIYIYLLVSCAKNYTNFDGNYGKTWMWFPDGNGIPQIMNLMPFMPNARANEKMSTKKQINFELYTRLFFLNFYSIKTPTYLYSTYIIFFFCLFNTYYLILIVVYYTNI